MKSNEKRKGEFLFFQGPKKAFPFSIKNPILLGNQTTTGLIFEFFLNCAEKGALLGFFFFCQNHCRFDLVVKQINKKPDSKNA